MSTEEQLRLRVETLEDRIVYLEQLLTENNIEFKKLFKQQNDQIVELTTVKKGPFETNLIEESLTKEAIERYSRQMILPEIRYQGQQQLQRSKVLVIGAGGIGAPAAYYLAGMGVGNIGIIDHDKVEESNLHRQIIHSADRVGVNKAISAKMTIQRFNPRVKVTAYPVQLTQENAAQIFKEYDIVLDASDNPKTRYLVNDSAVLAKIPLVSGSAVGWEGQLTVFNFNGGPCYRCLYPECPKAGSVKSCGEAGVVGMAPGVIGLLEALECLKIIVSVDKSKVLSQRMFIFDGLESTFKAFRIRGQQKNCLSCGDVILQSTIKDVKDYDYDEFVGASCSAQTFQEQPLFANISWSQLIKDIESKKLLDNTKFIDVRPKSQFDVANLKQFTNIPYEELKVMDDQQLQETLGSKENPIFVMCRRGNFSRFAGNELKRRGYQDVFNVVGGINEYGKDFDSSIPFV